MQVKNRPTPLVELQHWRHRRQECFGKLLHGLEIRPGVDQDVVDELYGVLGDKVRISNPLDYHTYIWGDYDALKQCFSAAMKQSADCTMLVIDYPRKDVCAADAWDLTEKALAEALEASGVPYQIAEGEGAFYGPKIDVHIKDAIGRRWQCSTIQLDFNLPDRFELEYTGAGNTSEKPYMIHCAKAGSIERFTGILVEHYAGAFPMWLAPVQISIIPVADRHAEVAAHDPAVPQELLLHRLRQVGRDREADAGAAAAAREDRLS